MIRCFHTVSVVSGIIALSVCTLAAQPLSKNENGPVEIIGHATNGLEPHLLIELYRSGWSIGIDLHALSNFQGNAWLKTTNREGCKLQCWLTNGFKLSLTNASIIEAGKLPSQTTVSSILGAVRPRDRRGLQWWPVAGRVVKVGDYYSMATFGLPLTNNLILQISPLIYKVDTNGTTAHLVEFPPTKLKLTSDGKVEEIK